MPPWCPLIPPHPAHEASAALSAPCLPQATTGMPYLPAELQKQLRPRATTFIEAFNPTEWQRNGGQRALAQSEGQSPQMSSISMLIGTE